MSEMSLDLFWKTLIEPAPRRGAGPLEALREPDPDLGRVGLLSNQTSFHLERGEYLFQALARVGRLHRAFLPEHGLFAELQDQVALDSGAIYERLAPGVDFVSLYGSREESLFVPPELIADLDTLIVDLQDVGSRYYTFATTVSYIFDVLKQNDAALRVLVVERANPAGRFIEGTILSPEYQSFVGRPGLPHRHGLSLGELCRFYLEETGARVELEIITDMNAAAHASEGARASVLKADAGAFSKVLSDLSQWTIPPSPNMPGPLTPLVYSGQCLLEGTNLNEGRGTTRPFEIFGAPYMRWIWDAAAVRDRPEESGCVLRPLQYIPTFHKFGGETCHGFQLHVRPDEAYHSLAHTLKLLRWIQEYSGTDFAWRDDTYEFRSDRPAIEILAGDPLLLDYLRGANGARFAGLRDRFADQEEAWLKRAASVLSPGVKLRRTELQASRDYL
ncbi:MAG: DUF1343 domain-containing protein [Leptospirales bacterium]|jgi:uncharacterized protein YbbC (DUF1343 family)